MDDIKRITPEEVVAAYRKTGLGVARGSSRDEYFGDGCGCGLGVYAVSNLGVSPGSVNATVNHALDVAGLSTEYRRGFVLGFDGDHFDSEFFVKPEEGRAGHDDGRKAWDAAIKEAANA